MQKRIAITTNPSLYRLFYDHILRWLIFILYLDDKLNAILFWVFQLLIIPILIIFFVAFRSDRRINKLENRFRKKVNQQFRDIHLSFDTEADSKFMLFSFFFTLIGTVSTYYVLSEKFGVFTLIIICILTFSFSIFYLIVLSTISKNPPRLNNICTINLEEYENENGKTVVKSKIPIPKDDFFAKKESVADEHKVSILDLSEQDYNSIEVVRLEGQVKNMSSKADSYLLESIFLGALAFSGFLSITSERVIESNTYIEFYTTIVLFFEKLINLELFKLEEILLSITSGDNLFALISIEALLCSIFFLLVIAMRLKLTSYLEKIDTLVRLGTLYHAKEEEVSNILLQNDAKPGNSKLKKRQGQLTQNLRACINDAENLLKKTSSVITIMVFLRNIGVSMFYLVLITSGMLFSYYFSFLIFTLAILIFFIKEIKSFFDSKKLNYILRNYNIVRGK